jgi:hypothetical protein
MYYKLEEEEERILIRERGIKEIKLTPWSRLLLEKLIYT